MDVEYKEVNFKDYCKICKYDNLKGYEDPCNECLEYGMNQYTQKPVKWEEK